MNKITTGLPAYIQLNDHIRPQDDFYAYVCHHWRQAHPLPATRSRWGLFNALKDQVDDQVAAIIDDWLAAEQSELEPAQRQTVTYYQALFNKDNYQGASFATLTDKITAIQQAELGRSGMARLLAKTKNWGLSAFFDVYAGLDSKNNQRYCLTIDAADLDLPNRDYYLGHQTQMKAFRQAYSNFLTKLAAELAKLGLETPLEPAAIIEVETFLARVSWPLHKERDSEKTYNLYNWPKLNDKFDFDWQAYCSEAGISADRDVIVAQPDCLEKTLAYLAELPPETLRGYLIHKLLLGFGNIINEHLAELYFDFFSRTLAGVEEMKTLKKRTTDNTNQAFCDVLGQAYVERHFQTDCKQQVEAMADQVAATFRRRLGASAWMSAPSRLYAQEKLDKIIINTGYSGCWSDYSGIDLAIDSPLSNTMALVGASTRKNFQLLDRQPDRRRFGSLTENVQTVNAWTNLVLLNTNYPAAFLQPPFFDHQASWTYNLGALGSVIGHELTHNFDDQGSCYDKSGHLAPWLNREERKAFKQAASKLIKTANKHHPVPKIKMKGQQVIGELIADLGGLEIVLDIVKDKYQDDAAQRKAALREVFIAYSFHFAINESVESRIMLAKAGVHPDSPFRVNGIIRHCADFYEVFDVKESDNLYLPPEERATIW